MQLGSRDLLATRCLEADHEVKPGSAQVRRDDVRSDDPMHDGGTQTKPCDLKGGRPQDDDERHAHGEKDAAEDNVSCPGQGPRHPARANRAAMATNCSRVTTSARSFTPTPAARMASSTGPRPQTAPASFASILRRCPNPAFTRRT